jgi:hypothetical protein
MEQKKAEESLSWSDRLERNGTVYLLQSDAWIACTCTRGRVSGG